MTTAKTLLLDLLAVIPDGERSATFFAADGAVESPFLYAIGIPTRYQGHVAIREFFNLVGGTLYPDFGFKPQDINVLIETPEQVFAEYTAHKAARTGRILHHMFAGRLVAKKGKITLLRESLNTVAAAQALNPNGVADLPPPQSEILSVPPDYLS